VVGVCDADEAGTFSQPRHRHGLLLFPHFSESYIHSVLLVFVYFNCLFVMEGFFCELCSKITIELRTSIPFCLNKMPDTGTKPDPIFNLQFALKACSLILLNQHITVGVRIDRQSIKRIQLTRPIKHIFIDFAILATQ
jgi:hypothetical protein